MPADAQGTLEKVEKKRVQQLSMLQEGDAEVRREFLDELPASCDEVLDRLNKIDDAWWVLAASIAAVRAGKDSWTVAEAMRVLNDAASRTASIDLAIQHEVNQGQKALEAWLDQSSDRLPKLMLRRQVWHMQWLLRMFLSEQAIIHDDLAALAGRPLLEHAHGLCLVGNAVGLRALLGAHVGVARALFPYRFSLLHTLIVAGGVLGEELYGLRLLPGTRMPVEDQETGAWIELAAKDLAPSAAAGLWVETASVHNVLLRHNLVTEIPSRPTPPKALSTWYFEIVYELESQLGLIQAACSLAETAVRLSLVPLRPVAHELRFLRLLHHTQTSHTPWTSAMLHAADAHTIVQSVVAQPHSIEKVVEMLCENVAPFLKHGNYADPGAFRDASDSEIAVQCAFLVLELRTKSSLAIAVHMVHKSISEQDLRLRLALAIIVSCEKINDESYDLLHSLSIIGAAKTDKQFATPLAQILAYTDRISTRACYDLLSSSSESDMQHTLQYLAICIEVGQLIQRHSLAFPVKFYMALDEQRTKSFCTALIKTARGNDAWLTSRIDDLAPYVSRNQHDLRLFPHETPVWLMTSLLANRAFGCYAALASYFCTSSKFHYTKEFAAQLALDAAHKWIHQAKSCDPIQAPFQYATECLAEAPHTAVIEKEQQFLATVSQLARYNLPSLHNAHQLLTPDEVRQTNDKLKIFAHLLAFHPTAYRAPQIRTLARSLCESSDSPSKMPHGVQDAHINAMLTESAASLNDFTAARDLCERTVGAVKAFPRDSLHEPAYDVAWRACFQLAKAPELSDSRVKSFAFSQAMHLAPSSQIAGILEVWRRDPPEVYVPHPPRHESRTSLARFLPPGILRGSSLGSRPDSRDASPSKPRETRSLLDDLQGDSPNSRHSAILSSTASLRDVVNTSLTRGMGWWMGGNESLQQDPS
ncbi:hypothetical protein MPSI1_003286 [Malassezia psittaci]|uniref:Sec39 domain-containing protein n=1 Tax=Malassezia psittaci TaxID=1821823 RepID=A0AAF0FHG2_9BASI|nr:hypothetical protein MPSI1_003286 [Malassezia psittaci]